MDMDMDMDGKFHIHGNPAIFRVVSGFRNNTLRACFVYVKYFRCI